MQKSFKINPEKLSVTIFLVGRGGQASRGGQAGRGGQVSHKKIMTSNLQSIETGQWPYKKEKAKNCGTCSMKNTSTNQC